MTDGQRLVTRIEEWIAGYMFLPDRGVALVAALWAINTWVFDRFDATPYLCITASTKGAGKTRLAELLSMISQTGRMFGAMTPASMFRLIEAYQSKLTIFFDEAETLSSSAAGVMRTVMNTGYRKGQTIPRTVPGANGGSVKEFPIYCPKAFMLIGDVNDTLRDRSIVLSLTRGTPAKEFDMSTAEAEARDILADLYRLNVPSLVAMADQIVPRFVTGRDREIWTAIFSVASALGLDKVATDRLTRTAADLTASKTAPKRHYREMAQDEDDAVDVTMADRAIADLVSVLRADEKHVFSGEAVERLRAIPEGPWRTVKGAGLDVTMLARLVSRFGLHPRDIKTYEGKDSSGKWRQRVTKGYRAVDVRASVKS